MVLKTKRLKERLEEANTSAKEYKKEEEKIMLRFPKNFHARLDDILGEMRQDYEGVLEAQNQYTVDKLNRIALNLDKIEQDITNQHRCRNYGIIEKLAPSLTVAFAANTDDVVEMLVDELLEDLVDYLNEMENLNKEGQDLIEARLKKNRLKKRLADNHMLHAWSLIEKLEGYKTDLCAEDDIEA